MQAFYFMKTLRLILTKEDYIYHDHNDGASEELFCRLTGKSSAFPTISIQDFNNDIKPILIDWGISYTLCREGEEKVAEAIIEAVNILEKMVCDYESSYQIKEKAINILKKAIP